MRKLLQKLVTLSTLAILAFGFLAPLAVGAQTPENKAVNDICKGIDIGSGGTCANDSGEPAVRRVIALAIHIFSFVVGIIAVIMIIVSGLKYITSVGDSSSVNSAKNTILYAVIGLVIVALAQVIVRYVLSNAAPARSESRSSIIRSV